MQRVEEQEQHFVIVGDSGVGKTHMLYAFTKDKIPSNIGPTISLQYTSKIIHLENNRKIRTQIWDTAGQQQYRSLPNQQANGVIITFDVTNPNTFKHVLDWINNVKDKTNSNVEIIIVGHKVDSPKRQISEGEARKLAQQQKLSYFQTTIYQTESITRSINHLIYEIARKKNLSKGSNSISLNNKEDEGGCKC